MALCFEGRIVKAEVFHMNSFADSSLNDVSVVVELAIGGAIAPLKLTELHRLLRINRTSVSVYLYLLEDKDVEAFKRLKNGRIGRMEPFDGKIVRPMIMFKDKEGGDEGSENGTGPGVHSSGPEDGTTGNRDESGAVGVDQ